jgi:hypothetical protein
MQSDDPTVPLARETGESEVIRTTGRRTTPHYEEEYQEGTLDEIRENPLHYVAILVASLALILSLVSLLGSRDDLREVNVDGQQCLVYQPDTAEQSLLYCTTVPVSEG